MTEPFRQVVSDDDQQWIDLSEDGESRRFVLKRDVKKRLDKYLCDRFPALSRSKLQKLINDGGVTVNDREPKASTVLRLGDVIDVEVPPPPIKQIPPEPIPIDILYEDKHLLVINKQKDLVVHPARSHLNGTLLNGLAYYFHQIKANGLEALSNVGVEEFRPGIVHRLDKNTTGVMVLAKNETTHWQLQQQFEKRKTQKYYLTVVHGQLQPPGDVIDQPIGKHPRVAEAYAVRNDNLGKQAVTLYRVREVFDGYSLVEIELKTGRTHQIRVHLTWLGFPIAGDIIYGGDYIGQAELDSPPPQVAGAQPMLTFARQKEEGLKIYDAADRRDDLILRRPALHASILQFTHPITRKPMSFSAPLWDDMSQFIRHLREHRRMSGPIHNPACQIEIDDLLSREPRPTVVQSTGPDNHDQTSN